MPWQCRGPAWCCAHYCLRMSNIEERHTKRGNALKIACYRGRRMSIATFKELATLQRGDGILIAVASYEVGKVWPHLRLLYLFGQAPAARASTADRCLAIPAAHKLRWSTCASCTDLACSQCSSPAQAVQRALQRLQRDCKADFEASRVAQLPNSIRQCT